MIFGMTTFTFVHVVLSLVAIAAGIVVMAGLLTARTFGRWTALFLATMLATDITGFGFPFVTLLPSHITGIISLIALAIAILGRYVFHFAGGWRWLYVVGAVIALYLDVFVLIVQLFIKVPAIHGLAPTQSEPPFLITQVVVLLLFIAVGIAGAIKFRVRPRFAT